MAFLGLKNKRALGYAIALHVLIVLVFIVGLDFSATKPAPQMPAPNEVVKAKAVDESVVSQEVDRLKQAEEQKKQAEQKKQQDLERKAKEAEQRRRQEEDRLKQIKEEQKQKEAENKRLDDEKQRIEQEKESVALQKKKLEEEKKLAEEKKRDDAREKKRLADEKKASEDKKALEEKKVAEQKKLADEKKRKEDEKRKAEQALKDAAEAEAEELAASDQARQDDSEIAKYVTAIKNAVQQQFVNPDPDTPLKCKLRVHMAPGGEVIDVAILKSSGNPAFDRQAEIAVRKASPLPVPDEDRLFQRMRELDFTYDPNQ